MKRFSRLKHAIGLKVLTAKNLHDAKKFYSASFKKLIAFIVFGENREESSRIAQASQSSSPNTYDVIGGTVMVGTSTYNLGDQTSSLSTASPSAIR